MLSKNVVPTPTGAPDDIIVDVAPEPTKVSNIQTGSPFDKSLNVPDSFSRKNFIVELLRTVIPVIIPEKPAEPLNPLIVSYGVTGTGAITLGTEELVYPRPGLVIVILVIIPAVISDRQSSHGHCVPETLQALTHNCISQIFNKLALAARREGKKEHSDSFIALEKEHYDKYQVLLKIGEQKQLESEYQEFIRLLGEDTNQWPLSIRRKFKI